MKRLIVSTDDAPEAERFDSWREALKGLVGVSAERKRDEEAPFRGRFAGARRDLSCGSAYVRPDTAYAAGRARLRDFPGTVKLGLFANSPAAHPKPSIPAR